MHDSNNLPRPIEQGTSERLREGLGRESCEGPQDGIQSATSAHMDDDTSLIANIGGPLSLRHRLQLPFFGLWAYVLEKTIARDIQLRKFGSSRDQNEH